MKYIQIIFVCEGESDEIYLRKIFNYYQSKDKDILNIKYQFKLLNGKNNFNKSKICSQIEDLKKKFKNNGKSFVIYFIDTDNIDYCSEDLNLFNRIESFTRDNSFFLVFFNKNIEYVINRNANSREKLKEARKYIFSPEIENRLKIENFKTLNSSNLLNIYFEIRNM